MDKNDSPVHRKNRRDWRPFYKKEAQNYEAMRYGTRYGRLFKSLHYDVLREFLVGAAPCQALDVAAGTGHVSELLASLGYDLTALDLTAEMLINARSRIEKKGLVARYILGNAFTLPFADETFGIVISTRFLHLWPEDQQRVLIAEMARVLKPGGFLISDFDNYRHREILRIPIFFYQRVLGRGRVSEDYYSKVAPIKTLIRDAGLHRLTIRGIGGYPLAIPLMVSNRLAYVIGRFIGRSPLYQLFSEQFIIRGQKHEAADGWPGH